MLILAIETSCDDTSVAIVRDGTHVLSSIVATQLEHNKYGGVVPEVAARAHIKNILPVLAECFSEAEVTWDEIDAIAVTRGPGLIGSLIIGVNTARTLAVLHKKPLIAVHHTEGHIYANWLHKASSELPTFPLVCLTVSGGHTNVIYMTDHLSYKIVGETQDDAAGEAYDKVAKILGLGYPGGPIIASQSIKGNKNKYLLPITDLTQAPSRNAEGFLEQAEPSLDFSYSGLKSAVLRLVKNIQKEHDLNDQDICDIAASFQHTANEILARNLQRAIQKYQPRSVLISGGVAANTALKLQIAEKLNKIGVGEFYYPEIKCCTDNAAMIASAAYYHAQKGDYTEPETLTPEPNLKLTSFDK